MKNNMLNMPSIEEIRGLLSEVRLNDLIGLEEDQFFEAKRKEAYHGFASPDDRYEFIKDVTAFANANGGYIFFV